MNDDSEKVNWYEGERQQEKEVWDDWIEFSISWRRNWIWRESLREHPSIISNKRPPLHWRVDRWIEKEWVSWYIERSISGDWIEKAIGITRREEIHFSIILFLFDEEDIEGIDWSDRMIEEDS